MEKNEFDEFNADDVAPVVPSATKEKSMISSGSPGTEYDWSTAPEGTKAPPRVDLNGQTVTIKKAIIVLPPMDRPWDKSRKGDKELKSCTFTIYYDTQSQQESLSGVRVFNREGLYSHPTCTRDRKNQASQLLGKVADYKKKDINEISLKEFMFFLNSAPKAKLIKMAFTNPETGVIVEKNMVEEFVNP